MAEHLVQLTQLDAGFKISICNSLWWSIEGGALRKLDAALRVFWRSRPGGRWGNVLDINN